MPRRQSSFLKDRAEPDTFAVVVALSEQAVLEPVETCDLLVAAKCRVVGDIVCDTHEFIECHDRRAMPPRNDTRRNRKILVARTFARTKLAAAGHCRLGAFS